MSDKSHVSMEQNQCFVCLTVFDTDAILLDRRLKPSMERHTVTGYGMCKKCSKLREEGYVALIVATKKHDVTAQIVEHGDVNRTGDMVHMRLTTFAKMFEGVGHNNGIAFIEPDVFEQIRQLHNKCEADNKTKQ